MKGTLHRQLDLFLNEFSFFQILLNVIPTISLRLALQPCLLFFLFILFALGHVLHPEQFAHIVELVCAYRGVSFTLFFWLHPIASEMFRIIEGLAERSAAKQASMHHIELRVSWVGRWRVVSVVICLAQQAPIAASDWSMPRVVPGGAFSPETLITTQIVWRKHTNCVEEGVYLENWPPASSRSHGLI
jgi:hypothetical protein